MPTQVMFEGRIEGALGAEPDDRLDVSSAAAPARSLHVELSLHDDLGAVEHDWRSFTESADCTVFQTFDWLSAWFRNIGAREGVTPAIVIGKRQGTILFLMPFCLEAKGGLVRRVTWLGSWLSNYNGPVLARDFPQRVDAGQFADVWADVRKLLRRELACDLIDLEKMPEAIGEQGNPFCALRVTPHVNDAYLTRLDADWDTYYAAKRSSATRKTDRKKRKRLADHGEVKFVTAANHGDVVWTVDALIDEKRKAYAKLGVANMFDWPGYRDFFLDVATGAQSASLTHLSRLDVGSVTAAANYGLTFRGRYYYILAGYDDGELARFGPGAAQLQDLLRYAGANGCSVFDFTIGDEPYKREWCDAETRLYDYVSPVSWRGWLAAGPVVALRQLKRRVKRSPRVWAMVRKMRMMTGSLRR